LRLSGAGLATLQTSTNSNDEAQTTDQTSAQGERDSASSAANIFPAHQDNG
jgi:hypothetical protein